VCVAYDVFCRIEKALTILEIKTFIMVSSTSILLQGLRLVAFSDDRINNVKGNPVISKTNMRRFKAHFGADPIVLLTIWNDLHTTANLPANHDPADTNTRLSVKGLLQAMHFLYSYKTEIEREAIFDEPPKIFRKECWYHLERVQALKSEKIVFPDSFGDDIWVMSVDGTNCAINEPTHPTFSQDKTYFSHKHKRSGLTYELGIHLYESKLIWMKGPIPAGQNNDKGIFIEEGGLKDKLVAIGKRALGDKIYNGHPAQCSTFNAYDSAAVKMFKSRAQMRHEQFNGMLKEHAALDSRFRHGEAKFKVCFEAAAVVCQYRLENGEPLFDLLAGFDDVVDDDEDEESDGN